MINMDDILKEMSEKEASDLYLIPGHVPMFRINDKLEPYNKEIITDKDSHKIAYSFMKEQQSIRFEKDWEMNVSYALAGGDRFRINIFKQRDEISLVLRRISTFIPYFERMHIPPILKNLVMEKRGLILVTGGTGSGKSTTIACMLEHRNQSTDGHIIAIEDPMEYFFRSKKSIVTQREVGIDTKSFMSAMKNAVRQAPDVLVVGEMRDGESVKMAINFAQTGHLVLSTLHSLNVTQSLQRILHFFPKDFSSMIFLELSINLKAIISQRLVPLKDEEGRRLATEIMLMTPRMRELIKNGDIGELKNAMEKSQEEGIHTFDQNLFSLYKEGLIDEETALINADSSNNLKLKIKGFGQDDIIIS